MTNTDPLVHLVQDSEVQAPASQIFEHFTVNGQEVPVWVRVMANNPQVLGGFFAVFKATMDDAPLPRVLKWKVAKVVSDLNKCEYCVGVTNMQLKQFELSDADIQNIEATFSEKEKLAVEYAKAMTEHAYKMPPELVERVTADFSDAELVELTAVVGLFNFINRFNDALNILPK